MAVSDAYLTGMSDRNLAFFGDSAIYTDTSAGTTTALFVWIEQQTEMIVQGFSGNVWVPVFNIEIMLSDVAAEPDAGDLFTLGTTVYKVQSVLSNDGLTCKMAVIKQ